MTLELTEEEINFIKAILDQVNIKLTAKDSALVTALAHSIIQKMEQQK